MKKIKKLVKKINKIVENIDIQNVIDKMKTDKEEELCLRQSEVKICYQDNEKYKINNKNQYNNYENYNGYELEEDLWTSLKAS